MPLLWSVTFGNPTFAAAPQLQGRIIDKASGQPIVRAEVSILGYTGERFTDAEGKFTWQPSPAPPFEVLVILPGGRYTKPVLVEALPASGTLDIAVESLVNEAVTVTAGAAPNIETTPASATTLVTAGEIETRAPATLAQALENVAGVSTVSEGHSQVPTVRGFSGGRTLILIDGARVTSERRVGPSATFLDPFVLESVEVARGPGSVAYGSDAFGGVIFARTRRVAPGSPLSFRFAGGAGTGVPELRGGAELAQGLARGGVIVQAHVRKFEDYRSARGDIFNSGSNDQGFLARLEHALGPGTLSAGWQSDFARDVERPRNNSRTVRFYYPQDDSHRFTAAYELHKMGGFERISTTAFLGASRVITDQDRFATPTAVRSIERSEVSARDYQIRVLGERTAKSAHLEFGVDLNGRYGLEAFEDRISFDAAGTSSTLTRNVSVDNAFRTDTGLFASAQLPASQKLLLAAGVRGDRVRTENQGGFFGDRSSQHTAGSGYASATYGSIAGFTFTAQVARGFRDPTLSDRYFRGPSGRGFITGNPDLEPERSTQFDGAVRYTAGRYRIALYAFHYRLHDLVERFQERTDFFFFRNRGRARMRGVEIETQADLGHGITLDLAAQFTRGEALDDGTPLDGVPVQSVSVQVRKQITTRGFVQARASAFARDDRPGPTEVVTPGYGVLDASAGWSFGDRLELRFLARNLLDKHYLVSPDTRTVPAPGTTGLLTFVVKVGKS